TGEYRDFSAVSLRDETLNLARQMRAHDEDSATFDKEYRRKALSLTSEIWSRVSIKISPTDPPEVGSGEYVILTGKLAGPNPMKSAAAFLEFMAAQLPP